LKAITTRSGLVIDGPTIPTHPQSINPEVDERVEETFTDPDLAEYTIKVPPPPVQKYKPPSQRKYVVHQRDPLHLNIPYPSRMLKQKQQEKDEVQIQNFWQMFKQLHINITLADALILKPKYQKMLKDLLSNKEKLQELANTPLNENCSAVILKKLPEKLGDPEKFLIPCGFSLPELISTHMTLELANRAICTPAGIARDVFVLVGKFTFPADFVIVDNESDLRVPLILGRPFLRTARALIDVHGEEMILCDGDDRLILNMRHATSSYSNQPQRESINLINVFNNSSEDFLENLFSNQPSGNPTFSSHPELTSSKFDIESDLKEIEFLLYLYDDPFDSKGEKIKESKLLIDELDLPCDFLPSEYDSFIFKDFSWVDALPSTNNEDKIFNPGFDPPFYEPLFFKEVPKSNILLPFSSENKEKVSKSGVYTSKKVHSSFIPELSHPGYKIFKINQIFKSPMKIFLFSCGKDTHTLAVPCLHFCPLDQFKCGGTSIPGNLKTNADGFCPPSLHFLSFN
nr:hypothetical protein [Tanacetum cinerariifolium]